MQKLVRYCTVEARCDSIVGANALYLCNRFNWALNDLLEDIVGLQNHFFGFLCAMAYQGTVAKCLFCDRICQFKGWEYDFWGRSHKLLSRDEINSLMGYVACE